MSIETPKKTGLVKAKGIKQTKPLPAPNSDGVNGISTDYDVARFFTDAEVIYNYEGTYQMQNLIVGKAITGFSAFV